MSNRSHLPIVVLIVGLANAGAFAWGFSILNTTLRYKNFSSSVSAGDNRDVIPLSNDRLAIVSNTRIEVFGVKSNGKVVRLDDVKTQYRELEPYMKDSNSYFDNPDRKYRATPTPSPTSLPGKQR
jgi:hypothetical protein